jgi:hypothetical protein
MSGADGLGVVLLERGTQKEVGRRLSGNPLFQTTSHASETVCGHAYISRARSVNSQLENLFQATKKDNALPSRMWTRIHASDSRLHR